MFRRVSVKLIGWQVSSQKTQRPDASSVGKNKRQALVPAKVGQPNYWPCALARKNPDCDPM